MTTALHRPRPLLQPEGRVVHPKATPDHVAARLLGVSGDDAEGSVRGRLLGVERVEGGLTYRIAFAFDLRLPLPGVDGLATIRVQQKVTQSPSLHSAQVRSHVRAKLAFDGSEHDQRNEQTLLRESLP